jgi:hypothetical protein
MTDNRDESGVVRDNDAEANQMKREIFASFLDRLCDKEWEKKLIKMYLPYIYGDKDVSALYIRRHQI